MHRTMFGSRTAWLLVSCLAVCGGGAASEPAVSETSAQESAGDAGALSDTLMFHASFDNGLDADRAAADPVLYTAPSYDEQDAGGARDSGTRR